MAVIKDRQKIPDRIFYYLLLAAILISLTGASLLALQNIRDDNARINLTGRERMLSQKLSKEIILFSYRLSSAEEISRTISVFDSSLNGLANGGMVPTDLNMKSFRKMPPISGGKIRAQFGLVVSDWLDFRKNALSYMNTGDKNSFSYIIKENDILLGEIDKAVSMIQEKSNQHTLIFQFMVLLTFLFVIGTLIYYLLRTVQAVRISTTEIRKLESLLPICSNCKKIRLENHDPHDQKSWVAVEEYFENRREISFTHGLCPECIEKLYPGLTDEAGNKKT